MPSGSTVTPDTPLSGSRAGDLARRIAHRRRELGLTTEELATRAGIDPTYLTYFEGSADARLSAGSLNLVALAQRPLRSLLPVATSTAHPAGGELDAILLSKLWRRTSATRIWLQVG